MALEMVVGYLRDHPQNVGHDANLVLLYTSPFG